MVTVEADERLMCCTEQGQGQVGAAELPDHWAGGVGPVLNLQVVMVCFGGEIQKLDVGT